MKKKNKILISIIAVVVISLVIGVSYALWIITKEQKGENIVNTACLDISIDDEANDISLQKAFPIEDSEGEKLKPYTFTVTNKCNDLATYQINLESLNKVSVENRLNPSYLKVKLNEVGENGIKSVLGNLSTTETTISDTYEAHKLMIGYLEGSQSKSFELRLWLDENVTKEDGVMDKQFKSKISVTSTYIEEEDIPTFAKEVVKCGQEGTSAVECINNNAYLDETLIYDDFKNLRYTGVAPNNYIDIGDKDSDGNPILWRIIGVMNSITTIDSEEKQENILKVIRADTIGGYSWDTCSNESNQGWGINEWSQADLMKLLNPQEVYSDTPEIGKSLYWNRESGNCYNDRSNGFKECDFTNTGLSENAKEKIIKVRWNTATFEKYNLDEWTAEATYKVERGSHNGKEACTNNGGGNYCNDNIERTTTWDGYVGLINPSDYGYAVGENVRNLCLEKSMADYNNDGCNLNNWLWYTSNYWTINPSPIDNRSSVVYRIYGAGGLSTGTDAYGATDVRPVVYLKSNIKITSGTGEEESPFVLE